MIDYEKLKIIAYDFDDTLFAHSNHKTKTLEEKIATPIEIVNYC